MLNRVATDFVLKLAAATTCGMPQCGDWRKYAIAIFTAGGSCGLTVIAY
jgi:hypothetical protein